MNEPRIIQKLILLQAHKNLCSIRVKFMGIRVEEKMSFM